MKEKCLPEVHVTLRLRSEELVSKRTELDMLVLLLQFVRQIDTGVWGDTSLSIWELWVNVLLSLQRAGHISWHTDGSSLDSRNG